MASTFSDEGLNPFGHLAAFRARWLTRRDELRRMHALVDGAELCDALLADLDAFVSESSEEALSLRRAAAESGYSVDHLGRLIREGKLPNVGRTNAPKIRRGDLPRKNTHRLASTATDSYDPNTDARSLLARRGD
jgi:hypothetical protein